MSLIILLLINIVIALAIWTVFLYRKLQSFKSSLASFKPVELQIWARIAVTKDEESQLSKNKDALRILNKLCEQLISLRLWTIDDKAMTDKDFHYLQWEIHALLDIKWRTTELYNKKIDE